MCCQGWLTGEAYGHRFAPGRPCGWLQPRGCSIYEHRPANPCQSFLCEWKRQPTIPDSLRPDLVGVIMVARVHAGREYIRVIESRGPVPDRIHEWAQTHSQQHSSNIVIPVTGGVRVYSSDPVFCSTIGEVYQIVAKPVDTQSQSS